MMKSTLHKEILRLAIPNIISNITVPLLAMVDMSIVGHLQSETYIGAIATASIVFNFLYWGVSFLRMGTSGFTAQAFGAGNKKEMGDILLRSLSLGFLFALLLLLFHPFIFNVAFKLIEATADVQTHAREYFEIYIWSAPAVLGMYAFMGWFIGMQDAKTPMFISIGINIVNILLSLFFVYGLGMNIKGVALGSTISQILGFSATVVLWNFKYKSIRTGMNLKVLKAWKSYIPFFKVNSDIFVRTLLLISVTTFFTSVSARSGNTVLAANALLMQLFTLFSYMMDGFAYAAEALTGKLIGEKKLDQLSKLIRTLFVWGVSLALIFTLSYALFTDPILSLLTNKADVIQLCKEYQGWVLLIPLAGFSAFLWDGIFIGATASRQMRNSMFIAVASFFLIYYILEPFWGNNALWLAFITYLAMRGFVQCVMYKTIERKIKR